MHPRSHTHLPSSSSWARMPSDLGNPFQNTPGQFIYALPNLGSTLPPNAAIRPSPAIGPQPPSVVEPKHKEDESPLSDEGHPPDLDTRSYSRQGEANPHTKQRKGSSTPTPSQTPSSVASSGSSSEEGQSEAEKNPKRTRRKRHRFRPPPDHGGLVMGPRAMSLQRMPFPRGTAHPVGSQQPWGPGYHGTAQPYRGPWPGPPPPPGHVRLPHS